MKRIEKENMSAELFHLPKGITNENDEYVNCTQCPKLSRCTFTDSLVVENFCIHLNSEIKDPKRCYCNCGIVFIWMIKQTPENVCLLLSKASNIK